jgi:hypothetical protein
MVRRHADITLVLMTYETLIYLLLRTNSPPSCPLHPLHRPLAYGSRFPLRCVCHWLILFILQVEHEIDKKLGITSKEDVMKMGIAKYNEE